jgi:hypothetical protein
MLYSETGKPRIARRATRIRSDPELGRVSRVSAVRRCLDAIYPKQPGGADMCILINNNVCCRHAPTWRVHSATRERRPNRRPQSCSVHSLRSDPMWPDAIIASALVYHTNRYVRDYFTLASLRDCASTAMSGHDWPIELRPRRRSGQASTQPRRSRLQTPGNARC